MDGWTNQLHQVPPNWPVPRTAHRAEARHGRLRRSLTATLSAAALLGAGCHQPTTEPAPESVQAPGQGPFASQTVRGQPVVKNPTTTQWQTTPLPAQVVDEPIQQGQPPLAYLAEVAGTTRIRDLTDNRLLVTTPVQMHQIISVSANGISVGGTIRLAGPLAADHEYGIYFDTGSGPSEIRSGTVRPH